MAMLRRKRERLRPLDEAAVYARCHGEREDTVRIVHLPPRREHYDLLLAGEQIRRSLEARIDARDAPERDGQPRQKQGASDAGMDVDPGDPGGEPLVAAGGEMVAQHLMEEVRVALRPEAGVPEEREGDHVGDPEPVAEQGVAAVEQRLGQP